MKKIILLCSIMFALGSCGDVADNKQLKIAVAYYNGDKDTIEITGTRGVYLNEGDLIKSDFNGGRTVLSSVRSYKIISEKVIK